MSTYWEEAQEKFDCDHEDTELRYCVLSDGRYSYNKQCLKCGKKGVSVKKKTIPSHRLEYLNEFDEDLRSNYNDARLDYQRQLMEDDDYSRKSERQIRYHEYLLTDEWKERRGKVLKRDNFLCQSCLENKAVTAHHTTYYENFDEPLFLLKAVCHECHKHIHSNATIIFMGKIDENE